MQIQKISTYNNYTNKRASFKRAPGMTTGAGGRWHNDSSQPHKNKKGASFVDVIYWTLIINTLAVNPFVVKKFNDSRQEQLQQYQQDAQSIDILEEVKKEIDSQGKTSNAFYQLNNFNSIEMPAFTKLDDSLYGAQFDMGDTKIGLTFSTDELEDNIISGEIASKKAAQPTELYSYRINLDTLGSKTFDIELKDRNGMNRIKQTYERDSEGMLYYVDKENNKKIPVNEYSYNRFIDKQRLQDEMLEIDRTYKKTQRLNYILCFIATVIQMMRYTPSRTNREEEQEGQN